MKVGLLTVHCSKNPGASLQAHALSKKLAELGGEVEVINYCPLCFLDPMDPVKRKTWPVKERIKAAIIGRAQQKRYDLFQEFNRKYLPGVSPRYDTPEDLKAADRDYDIYICGSDQIWNPGHVQYDSSFFFDYVPEGKAVLASYAASIGQDSLSQEDQEWLRRGISHLDAVSIREKAGVEQARELTRSEEIVQSIDPTLLYPGSYWRSLAQRPAEKLPERYILYYPIQNTGFSFDVIARMKKETGLPCVALDGGVKRNPNADIQIRAYGPCEFLWLLDHADYIITNSFHGTVLSLLLKKQVIVYRHSTRNSRLENILGLLNLKELQISNVEDVNKLDWKRIAEKEGRINELLGEERQRSEAYLRHVLAQRTEGTVYGGK
ncbi:MAG: polysaccharide pyruvyl transferase family protein [Oscillospiraceae bacterium]|nr:polysaccharide pyruvyl transferase family protein [Oscillospiraceae bacterium]